MTHFIYTIVAQDALKAMKGNRGRMIAQGQHACLHTYWDAVKRFPAAAEAYQGQQSAFKRVLAVEDETALRALQAFYTPICGVSLVEERGTRADGSINEDVKGVTALGIGPISEDDIADNLKSLRPLL